MILTQVFVLGLSVEIDDFWRGWAAICTPFASSLPWRFLGITSVGNGGIVGSLAFGNPPNLLLISDAGILYRLAKTFAFTGDLARHTMSTCDPTWLGVNAQKVLGRAGIARGLTFGEKLAESSILTGNSPE